MTFINHKFKKLCITNLVRTMRTATLFGQRFEQWIKRKESVLLLVGCRFKPYSVNFFACQWWSEGSVAPVLSVCIRVQATTICTDRRLQNKAFFQNTREKNNKKLFLKLYYPFTFQYVQLYDGLSLENLKMFDVV